MSQVAPPHLTPQFNQPSIHTQYPQTTYPPRNNLQPSPRQYSSDNKYSVNVTPPKNIQNISGNRNIQYLQVPGNHYINKQPIHGSQHVNIPISSNTTNNIGYINNHNIQHHQVPVEIVPPPPKPQSRNRVEYVPYDYYYTDYEERQIITTVAVPIQKRMMNYYQIEYITEYVPQEVDDFRLEPCQEQIIHKKIEYVPVEEEIIHIPKDVEYIMHNGQRIRNQLYQGQPAQSHLYTNQYPYGPGASRMQIHNAHQYNQRGGYIQDQIYNTRMGNVSQSRRTARTNYVTSDGYVPQFDPVHQRRIQEIISASNVHEDPPNFMGSRTNQRNYNQQNYGNNETINNNQRGMIDKSVNKGLADFFTNPSSGPNIDQRNSVNNNTYNNDQRSYVDKSVNKGITDFFSNLQQSNDYSPSKKLDGY